MEKDRIHGIRSSPWFFPVGFSRFYRWKKSRLADIAPMALRSGRHVSNRLRRGPDSAAGKVFKSSSCVVA
jgi:hypothetical protein